MRVAARRLPGPTTRVPPAPVTEPEHHSLAEQAYELLVRKITRLELPPGSVLVDKTFMEEFGIGRTPIREAMQRLAIERLVDHLPNRGMLVSGITAESVQQIYEFRSVLDGYAAWLAASRATPEQARAITAAHTRLVRATEDDDINAFVDGDRNFYRALSAATHNSLVADSIPRIFNLHLRLWFYISQRVGSWQHLAASHQQMTREVSDAIVQGEPDRARSAMEAYVSRRHQDIKKIL